MTWSAPRLLAVAVVATLGLATASGAPATASSLIASSLIASSLIASSLIASGPVAAGLPSPVLTAAAPVTVAASAARTVAGVADWDNDGHVDVIAKENATGLLWLYPGRSTRGYGWDARVQIGNGWSSYTLAGIADWDNDGNEDLIARDDQTGLLWLYPGRSTRGYSPAPRVQIGNGWNALTFVGVDDWDNDGHQDILARDDQTGLLWLYPGRSVRGYGWDARVQIGNGWNGYTAVGITDWDNDGHDDILVREDRTGLLWLYPGRSVRGYGWDARVQIGNGWSGYTAAGVADWDNDGHQDVVVREGRTHLLWLYPGRSVRGYGWDARVQIGNGW